MRKREGKVNSNGTKESFYKKDNLEKKCYFFTQKYLR
jgi:hypothetical protein